MSLPVRGTTAMLALTALVLLPGSSRLTAQTPRPRPRATGPAYRVQTGNPVIGKELFKRKGCIACHAIKGEGGKGGGDLGHVEHAHNDYTMAAVMWNHASHMEQAMKERGLKWPEFKGEEMAHIVAYLHSPEVVGDPEKGRQLFTSKGCVKCHSIWGEGGKIGPDLGDESYPPVTMLGQMWNQSPTMTAIMKGMGMERPTFSGNEIADLLAYLQQVQSKAKPAKGGR